MGLTWWPVAVAGFACLAVAVALAVLLPMEQARRQLRRLREHVAPHPAARVRPSCPRQAPVDARRGRLARIALRRHGGGQRSTERMVVVERGVRSLRRTSCCASVSRSPTQSTGAFLTYFAGQARTYGTQRIGLTSPNRRVIPMTRDYQYVAGKLNDLGRLSKKARRRSSTRQRVLLPRRGVRRLCGQRRRHPGAVHDRISVVRYQELTPTLADLSRARPDPRTRTRSGDHC